MKCSAARELIGDYVDGTLRSEEEKSLQSHLDRCENCRELVGDFQRITQEAKGLPSLSPSPLAWGKIAAGLREAQGEETRLREEKINWLSAVFQPARLRYAAATLLALVMIGGGLIVGLRPWKGEGEGKEGSVEFTVSKLKEAQRYYEKAIKALNDAAGAQKNGIDPQLAEVFKRNLDAMDETIQACHRMITKDPDNLAARAYLLTAYQEKVTFLEQYVGAKKRAAPERTETTL